MRIYLFALFHLFLLSDNLNAQDLYVRSYNNRNSLNVEYYSNGDPTYGSNLSFYYRIDIDNLELNSATKSKLSTCAKALFPSIFGKGPKGVNPLNAYKLAKKANIKLEFTRGQNVYAICTPHKDSYAYGISGMNVKNPYVLIDSAVLFVNTKTDYGQTDFNNICTDKQNNIINPTLEVGDTVKLLQNGKLIRVGRVTGPK